MTTYRICFNDAETGAGVAHAQGDNWAMAVMAWIKTVPLDAKPTQVITVDHRFGGEAFGPVVIDYRNPLFFNDDEDHPGALALNHDDL